MNSNVKGEIFINYQTCYRNTLSLSAPNDKNFPNFRRRLRQRVFFLFVTIFNQFFSIFEKYFQ